jgi:Family of unknown function (DUF5670)
MLRQILHCSDPNPFRKRVATKQWQIGPAEDDFGVTRALRQGVAKRRRIHMFLVLFAVLLFMWLLGMFAFHVAGGLIHLLLVIALISLVVHFFRRHATA